MTNLQAVLAIAAVIIAWITGLAILAFRIGRFEASTTTKMDLLEEGRKDNKIAVEKVEATMRVEIKELSKDMQQRFDSIFKEIVKK